MEEGLFVDNCGSLLGFDHKTCEVDASNGIMEDGKESDAKTSNDVAVRTARPDSYKVCLSFCFGFTIITCHKY